MATNYRATVAFNSFGVSLLAGDIVTQESLADWPGDALVNRIRLGDLVPTTDAVPEAVSPEGEGEVKDASNGDAGGTAAGSEADAGDSGSGEKAKAPKANSKK